MERSSTITASFPVGALRRIGEDVEPEEEEERTVVAKRFGRSVPFGSTLSAKPLRVRYDHTGKVQMTLAEGGELSMEQLPDWERRELFRHLRFMSDIGAL
jgi:hypothetical protein